MVKNLKSKIYWQDAKDISFKITHLIKTLNLSYIKPAYIICFRSFRSKSIARARIWSFPQVWQLALSLKPHYIIEVLSEKFDKLDHEEQIKILIHELMHIPKTFSGALVPHRSRYHRINHKSIESLYQLYINTNK